MRKLPPSKEPIGILDLLAHTDTDDAQTTLLRGHPDVTLRDEANAITAHAFRNGFLEDLHAGHCSPVRSDPGWSRISDAEMKKLMIETSARLAHWLYVRELLLDERPTGDLLLRLRHRPPGCMALLSLCGSASKV